MRKFALYIFLLLFAIQSCNEKSEVVPEEPEEGVLPQEGQARWACLGSLHCGQSETPGAFRPSCERRILRLDFEVFFFGTAIFKRSP